MTKEQRELKEKGLRKCTKCGRILPLDNFYFVKTRNCYWSRCNDCRVERKPKEQPATSGLEREIAELRAKVEADNERIKGKDVRRIRWEQYDCFCTHNEILLRNKLQEARVRYQKEYRSSL